MSNTRLFCGGGKHRFGGKGDPNLFCGRCLILNKSLWRRVEYIDLLKEGLVSPWLREKAERENPELAQLYPLN